MNARQRRLLVLIIGLVILAIGIVVLVQMGDLRARMSDFLALVRARGAPTFFLAMGILPLFGFPLAPFVLSAGPVFAPSIGVGAVIGWGVMALVANVSLAYLLAAWWMRPWMERLIHWLGYSVPQFPEGRSLEATLLLRVVPGVPFFLQSYLLGLARVRFGTYIAVSGLIPTLYLSAAVLAGDALAEGSRGRLLVAGVAITIIGLTLHLVRRRLKATRATQKTGTIESK